MFFRQIKAFTLIELIVTITILAIITTIALPHFHGLMAKQEIKSTTHNLIMSMHLAKNHAAIQHNNVVICPSADGLNCQANSWNSGYLGFMDINKNRQVDVDEKIIFTRAINLKYGNLDWRGTLSIPSLTFQASNGLPNGSNGSFYYCSSDQVTHSKVVLSRMGHIRVEHPVNC